MKLFLLILTLLLPPSFSIANELYRWVQPDGTVTYSSSEIHPQEAETIHVLDIPKKQASGGTTKDINNKEAASPPVTEQTETKYQSIVITSPLQDQTVRENSGNIRISINLQPALDKKSGHSIVFSLNGKETHSQSNSTTFKNVSRGQHTVQVRIENKNKKNLIQSQPVTFQLHRFSKLLKR